MNTWTQYSIDLANQRNYLDLLFSVYPTIPDHCREINQDTWNAIENSFHNRDTTTLITNLLDMDLFPIKDSYVAYLKRDRNAIGRNPQTINRLAGRIYELGLEKLFEKCSEPKETNRQIGPLFRRWIKRGVLGLTPVPSFQFTNNNENAILDGPDHELASFAQNYLGYSGNKGLDFVARFNGKYIIGEAKFLTDFGGHQNAQFNDAITTLNSTCDAIKIAILDGVLYIPGLHQQYRYLHENYNANIMSALVLRDFLYQV